MKLTTKQISTAIAIAAMALPMLVSAQVVPPPVPGLSSGFSGAGVDTIQEVILRIVSIALAIAGMIAILFLIIGGFRYVTAAGNEEAAESAKKTILNAIIGIIVIILAYVILKVIENALLGTI